jgi:hypothetical protein
MPPSTADERLAVHLGPAPIRDVLSSLLYGTDFNYVIQASDDDANGLDKVILTAKGEDSTEDGEAATTTAASERKIRLMPGYAAPGKRDFEVAHRQAVEAAQQQDSTAGLTITQDPSPTPDAPPESAPTSANADSASAAGAGQSADASSPTPDAGMQLQLAQQAQPGTTSPINSSSTSGAGSSLNKMEQDLQRMYQQRQQIQAQQNHPQPQGSTN